jgi:RNA polymerase sigma-70 factor (ECF subfamily)
MEWSTTSTILAHLVDFENDRAWGSFVDRFQPILVAHAHKLGFQSADAEDIAQTALLRFASAYRDGGYIKAKGTLRNWMFTITNRVMVDTFRAQARKRTVSVTGTEGERAFDLEDERARDSFGTAWDREMLARCLEKVRMEFSYSSYRAFVLLALHERPAVDIAKELGMTRRAVYLAKYRVLKRLVELRSDFEKLE